MYFSIIAIIFRETYCKHKTNITLFFLLLDQYVVKYSGCPYMVISDKQLWQLLKRSNPSPVG